MQSGKLKRSSPRGLFAGGGVAGAAGLASFARRVGPAFLNQYTGELKRRIVPASSIPTPHRWPDRGLFAAWLGHSTVLLKIDGFTILTDPVFSVRAGIHLGPMALGIKRLVAPALPVAGLPHIDLILLSHAHMDHTDLPSLRKLENPKTAVIIAANNSDLLRVRRYRQVQELCWRESARFGPAKVSAFEVNHWGARMRTDTFRGYNGYTIQIGRYKILFAGDTAMTSSFRALRDGKPYDLAIMPIGAYNPWIRVHCTPEQAWEMGNAARSEFFLPVHHQTFPLGREPKLEPIERFYDAAQSRPDRVAIRGIGQEWQIA